MRVKRSSGDAALLECRGRFVHGLLAHHLAADALGGRKVTRWPPPPGDRKTVLEALAEVHGLRVRYVATPRADRLALEA